MGIIACPKHGEVAFYDACEHVFADLKAGTYPDMISLPILDTRICKACDELMDTRDIPNIPLDEFVKRKDTEAERIMQRIEAKYELIPNRGQFCVHCTDEVHLATCRRNGAPDPFPAFEHTLLYEDLPTMLKLRGRLESHHVFPYSIKPHLKHHRAVYILPGSIRKPFEILLYGVTRPDDQYKLLSLIDDFFQRIVRYQRRVRFIEKELPLNRKTAEVVLLEKEFT